MSGDVTQAREALLAEIPDRPEWADFRRHIADGSISLLSDPASWIASCALSAFAKAIADERGRCAAECDKRAAWERAQVATSKTQRERLCFTNAAHALEEAATAIRASGGEGGR